MRTGGSCSSASLDFLKTWPFEAFSRGAANRRASAMGMKLGSITFALKKTFSKW